MSKKGNDYDLSEMTTKDLRAVPRLDVDWMVDIECRTIIILPTRRIHDSGYRVMEFVLEPVDTENGKLVRVVGSADVIHINAIGGWGNREERDGTLPKLVPPVGWQIDCLRRSGCLRLFILGGETIVMGNRLSSQEIWAKAKTAATVAT